MQYDKTQTQTGPEWSPRECSKPADVWTANATRILVEAEKALHGPTGVDARDWLQSRGLTSETIEAARLGWVEKDAWDTREAWVLETELREDGRPKKLWIPSGLVIPCFEDGRVVRLRIRRPNPGKGLRYYIVPESSTVVTVWGRKPVCMVVESELDAFLLWQEAGDLVSVVALGNAQTRPDVQAAKMLRKSWKVLVALDSDEAGACQSWGWWDRHFENATRWPVVEGKDPAEAYQAGLDLRFWILAGVPDLEAREERAAIMQFELGVSREEAEAAAYPEWKQAA